MWPVVLEIRQAGDARRLSGAFPYNETATIRSSGSGRSAPRKEVVRSGAFSYAIEAEDRDISLLQGHQFGYPLASKRAGTLKLVDGDDALRFSADLPPARSSPSWVEDTVRAVESNLMVGVSVGFQIPAGLKGAQRLVEEEGNPGIYVREVLDAVLHEISLVTVPAYKSAAAQLGKRSAEPAPRPRLGARRLAWL